MTWGSQTPYFTYNDSTFRATYPAFANTTTYPQASLQAYFNTAGSYLENANYSNYDVNTALNLMTAHLATISQLALNGETPGLATGASIDRVSITLTPPPVKSQFGWWLSLTPYGQQLFAMLSMRSAGGVFVGGSSTRGGFRGNRGYSGC